MHYPRIRLSCDRNRTGTNVNQLNYSLNFIEMKTTLNAATPQVFSAFIAYLHQIRIKIREDWKANNYDMNNVPTIDYTEGPKMFKVTYTSYGQTSVHCFVGKATGMIFKAATWNSPAKGSRGSIFNESKPLLGRDFYRS
jgi:hypothetical protein